MFTTTEPMHKDRDKDQTFNKDKMVFIPHVRKSLQGPRFAGGLGGGGSTLPMIFLTPESPSISAPGGRF